MPHLLQDAKPGTPVLDADGMQVGEVRAIYGSGSAQTPEFFLVYWTTRNEEALLPADEVTQFDDRGLNLRQRAQAYADRPAFDPAMNPVLHRL